MELVSDAFDGASLERYFLKVVVAAHMKSRSEDACETACLTWQQQQRSR